MWYMLPNGAADDSEDELKLHETILADLTNVTLSFVYLLVCMTQGTMAHGFNLEGRRMQISVILWPA